MRKARSFAAPFIITTSSALVACGPSAPPSTPTTNPPPPTHTNPPPAESSNEATDAVAQEPEPVSDETSEVAMAPAQALPMADGGARCTFFRKDGCPTNPPPNLACNPPPPRDVECPEGKGPGNVYERDDGCLYSCREGAEGCDDPNAEEPVACPG